MYFSAVIVFFGGGNVKIAIQNGQFTAPHVCAEMRQVNFRLSCIVSGVGLGVV